MVTICKLLLEKNTHGNDMQVVARCNTVAVKLHQTNTNEITKDIHMDQVHVFRKDI